MPKIQARRLCAEGAPFCLRASPRTVYRQLEVETEAASGEVVTWQVQNDSGISRFQAPAIIVRRVPELRNPVHFLPIRFVPRHVHADPPVVLMAESPR